MTYTLAHIREAARMFTHSFGKYNEYHGNPKQICEQIIDKCWNGTYFQTSAGHFTAFYCRDFGMCTASLINLGHKDKVIRTLRFALDVFKNNNRITTTITKSKKAIDCFAYGADSLPYLLHSIHQTNDKKLIAQYKAFLEQQAVIYINTVFDKSKNHVKENGAFSSMKDNYVRRSSCYDNCMVGWLLLTLAKLGYITPLTLTHKQIRDNILAKFWTGKSFKDDLYSNVASGDAQVYPFYTGIFDAKNRDKKLWLSSYAKIQEQGLDNPYPLKYTATRDKSKEMFVQSLLAPNYEGTTIWIHLGLCFLSVINEVDKKATRNYLSKYTKNISTYKNFLELFDEDGNPYKSVMYRCDESMIWASIYLKLISSTKL